MPDVSEIKSSVIDFIVGRTGMAREDVPLTDNLLAAGILDSFGFMEMILHFEQNFGLSIPMDENVLENYGSVTTIVTSIQFLQAQG